MWLVFDLEAQNKNEGKNPTLKLISSLRKKTKNAFSSYLLHEALHANTYFSEIDRLEQEEFERGGGPLEKWPPYFSGAREWSSLLGTVSRATARETAVKLVRLALARFSCSLCDDLSSQRSAFKLLKDAGKSAARKKELAKEAAAEALSLVSSTSGSSFAERLSARSVARWQRGPALALSAGATAFRSGLLFALADFIVSATTETVKALIEAAREARGIGASSEGEEREGERLAVVGRGESGGDSILAFSWLRSSSLSLARSLSEIVGAFFGVSLSTTKTTINPALTALLRSSAVSLAYASAAPSLIRSGAALVANPTSADFVLAGVASGALALAASTGALRAALGRQRAAALRAAVSRAAVRCSVGLSATSLAYGAAVAVGLPGWTWPGVQLAADNAAHAFLVGPALQEQAECGKVSEGRAVAVGAALAAGCVAAVGVL